MFKILLIYKNTIQWIIRCIHLFVITAPGSMPRDLTTVPVEGDPLSVTLNWQPPQKPNGQITGKGQ